MLARITTLFKMSLQLEYVPVSLRQSNVIFIPKPGKDDYTQPKSYRPITLSSVILKTLERVILNHLENTYLKRYPLSQNQHAFRKGSSCDSAISDMTDNIERAILNDKFALGVFLDITGAFSNVKLTSITRALRKRGLPDHLIAWFDKFLHTRTVSANIKGCKSSRKIMKGTPQGGVLSPLIWNLSLIHI